MPYGKGTYGSKVGRPPKRLRKRPNPGGVSKGVGRGISKGARPTGGPRTPSLMRRALAARRAMGKGGRPANGLMAGKSRNTSKRRKMPRPYKRKTL